MKKEVNINNYEEFVIDFMEDNLSPDMKLLFINFLDDNPEIAEEISDINDATLNADLFTFKDKAELKKPVIKEVAGIGEDNYEELFIAYHENDLDSERKSQVVDFIQVNKHLSKDFEIHNKLKLVPDFSIQYENKDSLKKVRKLPLLRYASIAAVIIILIGWSFSLFIRPVEKRNQLSLNQIKSKSISGYLATNINHYAPKARALVIIPDMIDEPKAEISVVTKRNEKGISQLYTKASEITLSDAYDYARLIDKATNYYTYDLAVYESKDPNENKDRSLFASVISNQWNKLTGQFKNPDKVSKNTDEPTYVQVLETGITVFNTITGSETYTSKTYNSEGELTSYQVEGRELVFNRSRGTGSMQ